MITVGLFPVTIYPNLRFLVFLVSTADLSHEVIGLGEDGIRRHNKADFEDQQLVEILYSLYQGTTTLVKTSKKSPAGLTLKSKIVPFLLKSSKAANQFPSMLQVCFDCLYGETSNLKLRGLGIAFVQWIARMVKKKIFFFF